MSSRAERFRKPAASAPELKSPRIPGGRPGGYTRTLPSGKLRSLDQMQQPITFIQNFLFPHTTLTSGDNGRTDVDGGGETCLLREEETLEACRDELRSLRQELTALKSKEELGRSKRVAACAQVWLFSVQASILTVRKNLLVTSSLQQTGSITTEAAQELRSAMALASVAADFYRCLWEEEEEEEGFSPASPTPSLSVYWTVVVLSSVFEPSSFSKAHDTLFRFQQLVISRHYQTQPQAMPALDDDRLSVAVALKDCDFAAVQYWLEKCSKMRRGGQREKEKLRSESGGQEEIVFLEAVKCASLLQKKCLIQSGFFSLKAFKPVDEVSSLPPLPTKLAKRFL